MNEAAAQKLADAEAVLAANQKAASDLAEAQAAAVAAKARAEALYAEIVRIIGKTE